MAKRLEKPIINSELELRCSVEWMAKMYSQREREAAEPCWDPESRREMAEETDVLRLKIEREVAEYLARKYGYLQEPEIIRAEAKEHASMAEIAA